MSILGFCFLDIICELGDRFVQFRPVVGENIATFVETFDKILHAEGYVGDVISWGLVACVRMVLVNDEEVISVRFELKVGKLTPLGLLGVTQEVT